MSSSVRIAFDVMGGDFAPANEIKGAMLVSSLFEQSGIDAQIILVGDAKKIDQMLRANDSRIRFEIVNAEDVITMHDEPSSVVRTRKESSLFKGMDLVKQGNADGFVSAGNTGAVLATATLHLGRIKGVSRPTIGSFLPSTGQFPTLLLDVGGNVDSKPNFIYEYGVMGSVYFSSIMKTKNPSVGLLNVGEEETKGSEAVIQALDLFKKSSLNFVGNVEGRDILTGKVNVVACDGFTGNIVLKFAESVISVLKEKVRQFADKSFVNKVKAGVIAPTLRAILKEFDYQEYGGVPLLGVNGVVIIGHGSSTPLAIQNMLVRAVEMVNLNVNHAIEIALQKAN